MAFEVGLVAFLISLVFASLAENVVHRLMHSSKVPHLPPTPTRCSMWHHNFGISFDVWDRVFRTYKAVEWKPEKKPFEHKLTEISRIRWF